MSQALKNGKNYINAVLRPRIKGLFPLPEIKLGNDVFEQYVADLITDMYWAFHSKTVSSRDTCGTF